MAGFTRPTNIGIQTMDNLNTLWLGFRSLIFWVGFAISTMLYGLITPILFFLSHDRGFAILITWAHFNTWWIKVTCGVKFQIKNPENIDKSQAHIVLANHQSTWETLAIPTIIPPFAWVLKKELFKLPFFGWALKILTPIAIDRAAGRSAIEQIKNQGKKKLDAGIWICMFPEGTRIAPDKTGRYKLGGAILAEHTGYPVIPIAHNAGASWPRHGFIKKPGTITISIGPKIKSKDRKAAEIMKDVKEWIELEKETLPAL